MKLTLQNIDINSMENSVGVFIGKTNILKQFRGEKSINEVIGNISGNENKLRHGCWIKNKVKEG
ncbi:hypothetical protein HPT25_04700 [Bacillus sp. BRMEA1]|uniref:hypothetical protein n=1 Tax=Neobacillus endophyticus TaxID=2738405 RepID=UPI0015676104|nr:hypothetical protein [Neobacillus endophyticus]NRD76790.1 hypothetical protein [Neobacillus endophyticus]